jgi:hypothetical protein
MSKRFVVLAAALACALGAAFPEGATAGAWCGSDQATTDRPDLVGGSKFHLIYAMPSDGADRFLETAPKIVTDVNVVLSWWAREDQGRAPRFDLASFPGCGTAVGALDISFVRLSQPASAYHVYEGRLVTLSREIAATFAERSKKYIVVYDGPVADDNVCGSAYGREDPTSGGLYAVSAIYIQNRPWSPGCGLFGTEAYNAKTLAHELLHMIGAVPTGAPHESGGHVTERNDVMYSGGCCERLAEYGLDIGRDDYYGHSSTWWDTQDSRWLTQGPDRTLAVSLVGAHAGDSVASQPSGLACPRTCSFPWAGGETVVLSPAPGEASRFVRWEGDCSGIGDCSVVLDADRRATAVFGPSAYPFALTVSGTGAVTTDWIETCRRTCRFEVDADAPIALRARPGKGWRFAGWRGACARAKVSPRCSLTVTGARSVTAVFRRKPS